jgi:hypothetical protein
LPISASPVAISALSSPWLVAPAKAHRADMSAEGGSRTDLPSFSAVAMRVF